MTKTSPKIRLKKFLTVCLLTFAVFSNVGLVFANQAADDKAAEAAALAAQQKLDAAEAASQARTSYSSFSLSNLKAGGQSQGYFVNGSNNTVSTNPLASFILQIINFITITAGSLSFLAVVIGGFMIMSSAGSENQVNKGKDLLQHALIGLAITLTAYFVVAFVQSLLFETVK